MKKLIIACLVGIFAVTAPMSSSAKDSTATATILSAIMPGTGEWYNSGWSGGYPWGECVVGALCFCFRLSSVLDAANGNATSEMRFDFWTAPK